MYLIHELDNTIVGYEVTYKSNSIQLKEIFSIGAHGEGKPVPNNAAASEVVVSVSWTDTTYTIRCNESIY